MICPQCGAEFVEGVELCADCGVPPVAAPPEPAAAPPRRLKGLVWVYLVLLGLFVAWGLVSLYQQLFP